MRETTRTTLVAAFVGGLVLALAGGAVAPTGATTDGREEPASAPGAATNEIGAPTGATTSGSPSVAAETTQSCEFPVTRTDATGTEVTLSEAPSRVVTLNPSAAQTMWEIGAREKVVGVTKYASNLEGSSSRTNVSTGESIVSVETVVGLEPDLVLAPNASDPDTVEKLREADVTVYHYPAAENLDGIEEKVRVTGRLVGACEGAAATVREMERELAVVEEAVEDRERPDVLYTFYGYTAGEGTFIHTIIETAGGNNVAADANVTGYKPVNQEFVVDADPDWIVRDSDTPTVPRNDAYNETTAVQEGQVVVVRSEHLKRPAPRVVRAISTLAETFHPEAYAEANASVSTVGGIGGEDGSGATDGNGTTDGDETADTAAPGFGVVAALVALTAAALAAGRDP